jgi:hypothetical protein
MLPGTKHRIKIWPSNRSGQTIVRPARFGSVITASSARQPHDMLPSFFRLKKPFNAYRRSAR